LLFYILVGIEFLALIKSFEIFLKGEDITWQKWNRQGVGINREFIKLEA